MKQNRWVACLALISMAVPMSGCVPAVVVGAAATGVVVATDRRTTGTQMDDTRNSTAISFKVNEKYGDLVHVSVNGYNGVILLTGEVFEQSVLDDVLKIASAHERVRTIQNELIIAKPSPMSSRTNDSYITSKVKTRFVDSEFSPTHVKVVTERGVVYLMGIVTKSEAEQATDIARKTNGVKRVVRVFEYKN